MTTVHTTATKPTTQFVIWATYAKRVIVAGFVSADEAYAWIDNHYPHKKGYTVREIPMS